MNSSLEVKLQKEIFFPNIVTCKWSPSGEYAIIIHDHGKSFSIINSILETLYTKSIFIPSYSNKLINLTWAPNSNYFILYSNNSIFFYNMLNLNNKIWTDFAGNITDIIISSNSNYIFIYTNATENPVYLIYNINEDFYNYDSNIYDSFTNIPQSYTHNGFKTFYKIFSLYYSEDKIVTKARINLTCNRLVVLYSDLKDNIKTLKIFEISLLKSVHEIKINLM